MRKVSGKIKLCTALCSIVLPVLCLSGCGMVTEGDGFGSGTDISYSEGSRTSGFPSGVDIGALLQTTDVEEGDLLWAGSQYVDGEEITLLRGTSEGGDLATAQDIYKKDADGTLTKIISNAPGEYTEEWYYTPEGYCYAVFQNKLVRIEADGVETYQSMIGADIVDICRLEEGKLFLVVQENTNNYYLAEVQEDTGEFEIREDFNFGRDKRTYLAEGEDGLLVLNSKGLWLVDTDAGVIVEKIPMSEYDTRLDYTVKDFKVLGGASLVLLNRDYVEVIHPKDIEKYREIVTVQTRWENAWLRAMLDEFNGNNGEYYVVLETLMKVSEDGNSMKGLSYEEMEKEIASGGAGDLIAGDCLECSRFVDEGFWEDLTPYMEQAGMEITDYFPAAFEQGKRGDSIYIANLYLTMNGLRIGERVLGSREIPDVETLVDKLLDYEEPSVLNDGWSSEDVLRYLLSGSEDLHGTVDWEKGSCDFESNFFYKVLEAAMLFGDDGGDLPAVGKWYDQNGFYNYLNAEQLELAEEVYLGYLFEDGGYPVMSGGVSLSMNANSDCKEGAWAVLEFLLSEDAQTQKRLIDEEGRRLDNRQYPVNVYAFEEVILLEQEEGSYFMWKVPKTGWLDSVIKGNEVENYVNWNEAAYKLLNDLTEADIEEVRKLVYEVRYLPEKPAEILELVCEEAGEYFGGERSLDDTCRAIQDRVQKYLDEYGR